MRATFLLGKFLDLVLDFASVGLLWASLRRHLEWNFKENLATLVQASNIDVGAGGVRSIDVFNITASWRVGLENILLKRTKYEWK